MGYRTDLAIERKELLDEEHGSGVEIEGVHMEKVHYDDSIISTRISIVSDVGALAMEKPIGKYITIEADGILEEDDDAKGRLTKALTNELRQLIKFHYRLKVLVAGLGNKMVTPDSLGPMVASKIKVTRHLFVMFDADGDNELSCVSCIVPGVTAITGMETVDIIRKAVDICDPDVVIVIDSLAARNISRVSTTIQITDAGISPGAGMGNRRKGVSKETVGTEVIAIGVPTVIDVTTIIRDALRENLYSAEETERYIEKYDEQMIVTSTDIDAIIKDFSDVIADGINNTIHPGIYSQ